MGNLFWGKPKLRPYVEVSLVHASNLKVAVVSRQTRVVDAGSRTSFGECLSLPLRGSVGSAAPWNNHVLRFQVFDARGVQAAIRGDPLIGSAQLVLDEAQLCSSTQTLTLARPGAGGQGSLSVRVGLSASSAAHNVLGNAEALPLADVAGALAQLLSQPRGVNVLMDARPEELRTAHATDDDTLRRIMQRWIQRFSSISRRLSGFGDDQAMAILAQTVRAAQQIVAACAARELDGEEVQELTVRWVRNMLASCVPPGQPVPVLNESRLRRLLQRSAPGRLDGSLRSLGVSLPEGVEDVDAEAILARLLEAQQAEEDEIFTGARIVEGGKLAPGMAAILRRARGGGAPHVFIYSHEDITKWIEERGTDPNTRERINAECVIALDVEA
eukprot:NODE_860_length_1336_cov_167.732240.p1 GENE.NODE_860_length_1336_cov_167.732240~~NODE_860_length_1336_cov_167.732240.p1  ORF type:complete len:386 (+),score=127.50 NODE_860_length_1336_cov_167.732240:3-1160(+)